MVWKQILKKRVMIIMKLSAAREVLTSSFLDLVTTGTLVLTSLELLSKKETHCVDLTESTIEANKRFFASEDEVPRQAYTMGIKNIMQAKKILVVVSGKDKAEILKKVLYGAITPEVPASILQLHNDVTIVADEAALSEIDK